MNGHLALNEPGTAFDAGAHVCPLDPLTANVGQKYFTDGASLTGSITLGIGDFRRSPGALNKYLVNNQTVNRISLPVGMYLRYLTPAALSIRLDAITDGVSGYLSSP